MNEDLFEFVIAIVGKGRDELLRELLAGQCNVGLVDRDGLPRRLVQIVPLIVSAYEIIKCRKGIALSESLKDKGGHESQSDRQQREDLLVVHAGTNEELDVIAESMNLLWGKTSDGSEEGGGDGSERELTTVTDALSAKARTWKV